MLLVYVMYSYDKRIFLHHYAGSPLQHKVQFTWINQEDESEVRHQYKDAF